MDIDLEQLEEDKKKNVQERLEFVEFWAEYIRTHTDKEWSEPQKMLIDSQIKGARSLVKK